MKPESMRRSRCLIAATTLLLGLAGGEGAPSRITVDPTTTRSIAGTSELKREVYFGVCDYGTDFDHRMKSEARYLDLVKTNGVTFGRALGIVYGLDKWYQAVREDAARPGFADIAFLKQKMEAVRKNPSDRFRKDMGGRLDIAAHENNNSCPPFMGAYATPEVAKEKKPSLLPTNFAAAAEILVATLESKYTDFDRPRYVELVNEPHWSYTHGQDRQLADWYLAAHGAVRKALPGVQVGGPCMPVAYFYGKQYETFKGLRNWIDQTKGSLDFYSFHIYDYLREREGDFGGRITSGLPLESVLDLVQNYMVNTYGKTTGIVVSEHGGYGADGLVERLAKEKFTEAGFDFEMKRRSIEDFNMVRSTIANALVFMDHPHTILKAVPFILPESMGWDPKYYATLFVPRNYTDKTDWVPTKKILYYKMFRDVKGRRIHAPCMDPDLQVRAFAEGDTVSLVVNNLSDVAKDAVLDMPLPVSAELRRFGRNPDFTPAYAEGKWDNPGTLRLAGRETAVIRAAYGKPLTAKRVVDEVPCYGTTWGSKGGGEISVQVKVPPGPLVWATLRVGISRPSGSSPDVAVQWNGKPVATAPEACAPRLDEPGGDYASCKILSIPVADVKEINTVTVSFGDGKPGAVGAVVLRAGREKK